jgi:hypothetical protein
MAGGLDQAPKSQEIANVRTVIADKYKRVRLPDAKPKQVFAYANSGETITLTPVKTNKAKPRFPRGSLLKYFTGDAGRERDKLETAIASGCLQGPPD